MSQPTSARIALLSIRVGERRRHARRGHPFSHHPSFAEVAALPPAQRPSRLRDPARRAAILAEEPVGLSRFWRPKMRDFERMYLLGDPPEYEPGPERSIAALGGPDPLGYAYDTLTAGDGSRLYLPFINYSDGNLDAQLQMMRDPGCVLSLADGGAHCGLI